MREISAELVLDTNSYVVIEGNLSQAYIHALVQIDEWERDAVGTAWFKAHVILDFGNDTQPEGVYFRFNEMDAADFPEFELVSEGDARRMILAFGERRMRIEQERNTTQTGTQAGADLVENRIDEEQERGDELESNFNIAQRPVPEWISERNTLIIEESNHDQRQDTTPVHGSSMNRIRAIQAAVSNVAASVYGRQSRTATRDPQNNMEPTVALENHNDEAEVVEVELPRLTVIDLSSITGKRLTPNIIPPKSELLLTGKSKENLKTLITPKYIDYTGEELMQVIDKTGHQLLVGMPLETSELLLRWIEKKKSETIQITIQNKQGGVLKMSGETLKVFYLENKTFLVVESTTTASDGIPETPYVVRLSEDLMKEASFEQDPLTGFDLQEILAGYRGLNYDEIPSQRELTAEFKRPNQEEVHLEISEGLMKAIEYFEFMGGDLTKIPRLASHLEVDSDLRQAS